MAGSDSVPHVHALLICERIDQDQTGALSLQNVTEVLAVDAFPAEVGPLHFVAFVRDLPPGGSEAAFVLRSAATGTELGRIPLADVQVPDGLAGRQLALQVRVPKLPVGEGGWYEVAFAWGDRELAWNRFAVGQRQGPSA